MRALARDARMIVMDGLARRRSPVLDVERLHQIIQALAAGQGKTVLLVSHFLREVLELADTVTVMRDGKIVRTAAVARGDRGIADTRAMLGRPLNAAYPPQGGYDRLRRPSRLAVRGP